jgi:LDH2 family malate/lactate/ureidoglycolate dehydrogenase
MKAVPLAPGAEAVFHPGEIEARAEIENRRDGPLLPDHTRADLHRLAEAHGLDPASPTVAP